METETQTHQDLTPDATVRPPLADRLKATEYKGEYGLDQAILDLPIDRLDNGVPVKDVIAECEALARAVWDNFPTIIRKKTSGTGARKPDRSRIPATASSRRRAGRTRA